MDLTAWFSAAETGNLETVEQMHAPFVNQTTSKGRTALMIAASMGHSHVCEFLVRFESRQTTEKGTTALMFATEAGHADVVAVLAPCESRIRASTSEPAIIRAIRKGHRAIVDILLVYELCYAPDCLAVAKLLRQEEIYKMIKHRINEGFAKAYALQTPLVSLSWVQSNLGSIRPQQEEPQAEIGENGQNSKTDANAELIAMLTTEVEDLRAIRYEHEKLKAVCEAYQEQIHELTLDTEALFTDNMTLRRDKEKHLKALKRIGPCPTCKQSKQTLQDQLAENARLAAELSTEKTRLLSVMSQSLIKKL